MAHSRSMKSRYFAVVGDDGEIGEHGRRHEQGIAPPPERFGPGRRGVLNSWSMRLRMGASMAGSWLARVELEIGLTDSLVVGVVDAWTGLEVKAVARYAGRPECTCRRQPGVAPPAARGTGRRTSNRSAPGCWLTAGSASRRRVSIARTRSFAIELRGKIGGERSWLRSVCRPRKPRTAWERPARRELQFELRCLRASTWAARVSAGIRILRLGKRRTPGGSACLGCFSDRTPSVTTAVGGLARKHLEAAAARCQCIRR